ncbi:MAG: hypothetical protein A2600_10480 [Candidatus Lambdaproteobacteria bacterium RIFOXYD1_FULL_56_27]|uniref:Uncharacterized protein n=1 Tax=Candidatus Lambdaproteobacteria bacterium RIFOXYD2_FULL_56_26 TaxID=1817773 RepID=A0A1F6GQA5_9PROT|nr:MAG: hypothetical protein A2557_09205 [Candidatus Lambdaproteobacteria bacterium RIFOXYD2_FULL_56_26]OGH04110.1 MAG: hypothetical protein A2426_02595 [Candidatus Lambdaproteobacteria bacterium RIFOXYC1_FULL_56_13]OGH06373.1 MAG: hypothetical protein A2600_10480 [Candidatus Lambdaproteobacteria bacterium RIFOXYD1_FULL_56_27]
MPHRKLNPYTQAIQNCLEGLPANNPNPELDSSTAQFLANMIQGRFVQYLIVRIATDHNILGRGLEKELSLVFMNLLTDKFFAVFREKVKADPSLVLIIARKITEAELADPDDLEVSDILYRNLCRRYFDYIYFDYLLVWLSTSPEVERIVFLAQVEMKLADTKVQRAIRHILRDDKAGIVPLLFNRYLGKGRLERLVSLVTSGDWRLEAAFLESRAAHGRAWREFMAQI